MFPKQFPWENTKYFISWKIRMPWALYPGESANPEPENNTLRTVGKHDGTWTFTGSKRVCHLHGLDRRRWGDPREWSSCESTVTRDTRRVFVPEMRTTHFRLLYSFASPPSFVYIPFRQWYDWPNQMVLHNNKMHYRNKYGALLISVLTNANCNDEYLICK